MSIRVTLFLFGVYFLKITGLVAQDAALLEQFRQLKSFEERKAFFSETNLKRIDRPTFAALLPIIREKGTQRDLFFWHFRKSIMAGTLGFNQVEFEKNIEDMLEIARKNKFEVESYVAFYQQTLNEYSRKIISEQQAYAAYFYCFEQVKRLGFEPFKDYAGDWMLHEIGRNFYELGDTEKALECLMLAEKHTAPTSHFYTLSTNIIETIYADRKDFPSAFRFAQKIYDVNYQMNPQRDTTDWLHIFWQGLASLNMADYQFEMGDLAQCEQLAERGYRLSTIKQDLTNTNISVAEFEALQVVIKVKLALGKWREVEPLFRRVEILKPHLGLGMESYYFKPLKLYRNYVKYYEAQKDYPKAYEYLKMADALQDSLNRRNDKRKLWQTEMRVKADQYQSQLKKAEDESRLQQTLRNVALLVMLIVLAVAFVVYRRIKRDNHTIASQKEQLEQSLVEKETLLKEIHHRVKNNLQIISGLLEKQASKTNDLTAKKLMKEGQDRVFSMALVHQNLYQSDNLNAVAIKSYLQMLVGNIRQSYVSSDLKIALELDVDDSTVDIDTAIPLGLILNELVTNCYKYAFQNRNSGKITLRFRRKSNRLKLTVEDNGEGLPTDFDARSVRSLGMSLVRGLVRQMGGTLRWQSNTEGVIFEVDCPYNSANLS